MQIQPLWAYDLIDHVQFWQTEQGFDTIDIHEQGSFFWVTCFLECCEESCACQQPLSVPCYQAQTLASNLAKSHRSEFKSLSAARQPAVAEALSLGKTQTLQ